MSTKRETFKLVLVDGDIFELRVIDRIGSFVAHPPWQNPKSRSLLVVTHEPDGCFMIESYAKIVRAFMNGAKTGKTLARVAEAWRKKCDGQAFDVNSKEGIAWRAVRRYQKMLEERIAL